jgi:hypothetical protein
MFNKKCGSFGVQEVPHHIPKPKPDCTQEQQIPSKYRYYRYFSQLETIVNDEYGCFDQEMLAVAGLAGCEL